MFFIFKLYKGAPAATAISFAGSLLILAGSALLISGAKGAGPIVLIVGAALLVVGIGLFRAAENIAEAKYASQSYSPGRPPAQEVEWRDDTHRAPAEPKALPEPRPAEPEAAQEADAAPVQEAAPNPDAASEQDVPSHGMSFCPRCGRKVDAEDLFCRRCGRRLG